MAALKHRVVAAARDFRPDVIHGHSPVLVGWPALAAARQFGIPFVYEVRDLWENASIDVGKFSAGSPLYRLARAADSLLLAKSDAVVAICSTLGDALALRTGSPSKVFVVDNGVDIDMDLGLEAARPKVKWGLEGKDVLCYVGTFKPYEGLELLLEALSHIVDRRPETHLLVVGSGEQDAVLRATVERLGLQKAVTFTGALPHSQVAGAYAAADVMVYPRILTRTTALTTPLKPLEAMAMMKTVIASDIPPMRELVQHDVTGLLFRTGDAADLARTCLLALAEPARRARLNQNAREWVANQRQWRTLVQRYLIIYQNAIAHRRTGAR